MRDSPNRETALNLADAGHSVFPCHAGGDRAKSPRGFFSWSAESTTNRGKILDWWSKWPEAAIGLDLAKSGLIVIDADRHGEDDGVAAFGALMAEHGFNPDSTPLVATPNEGNHHFFKQPAGQRMGNRKGALPPGIDVRGSGGYVIAPGSIMADGRFYELHGELGSAVELPQWLVNIIQSKGYSPSNDESPTTEYVAPPANSIKSERSIEEIGDLLNTIDPDCAYNEWLEALMAVHAETGGSQSGFNLADTWSARGSKYKGSKEIAAKWRSFKSGGVQGGTLAALARKYGADLSAIAIRHMPEAPLPTAADLEASRRLIENYDGSLADAETGEVVTAPSPRKSQIDSTYPPGLVGRLAEWIVDSSRRPQQELAIGAALAIVGTCAGRQFAGPTRSGTQLYILGLAPTGAGKDHPLQQIGRVMTAANFSHHIGPSEFISMPAVVNFIGRKPLSICAMDEFGSFMKRINSKRASGFESAISKILRQMWSSSFAPYSTPEWAGKESVTIHAPCISMYGTSTPEQFYSAMEGASMEDGTLNRFLLINGRDQTNERDPVRDPSQVPQDIIHDLEFIYYASGQLAGTWRNQSDMDPSQGNGIREVTWCPDGSQERYRAFSDEMARMMRANPETGAFYARSAEMALRIATILAIGRMDGNHSVRIDELEWSIDLAQRSADMMKEGAADYMSENEYQANSQRILRVLKKRGGVVRYSQLLRSLQRTIKARELNELLVFMTEEGAIECVDVQSSSGPVSKAYRFIG